MPGTTAARLIRCGGALFCGRADVVACALFAGGSALVPMPLHVKCRQAAVLAGESCGPWRERGCLESSGGLHAALTLLLCFRRTSRSFLAAAGRTAGAFPVRGVAHGILWPASMRSCSAAQPACCPDYGAGAASQHPLLPGDYARRERWCDSGTQRPAFYTAHSSIAPSVVSDVLRVK